jgi:surfactin synthase thioesterase subunit
MIGTTQDRWLRRFRDDGTCPTLVVCLPHAGGSANAYRTWHHGLPPDIGVLALQYPGREDRLADPFPAGLEELADDVTRALGDLAHRRLVLFGHSMGASVAHEVALRLHRRGTPPAALCVSGRRPPHELAGLPRLSGTDKEIIADVVRAEPSHAEVFADPGLREVVLPALRADYRLVDDYQGGHRPPLDCPVYAYTGDSDPIADPARMRGWAETTRGAFRLGVLPGGHFYLRAEQATLLADLDELIRRAAPATITRPPARRMDHRTEDPPVGD